MEFKPSEILLTKYEFDILPNYSCSLPTGIVLGKRWKRAVHYHRQKPTDEWLMGEYAEHKDPTKAKIIWRTITIVGELEIDKDIEKFKRR